MQIKEENIIKKGESLEANIYDFLSLIDGKSNSIWVYNIQQNNAWVNIGISKDTVSFAVSTLKN